MANDCLVINLDSEIDDPALPVLGALDFEIALSISAVNEVMCLQVGTKDSGCLIEILDNGNFYTGYAGTVVGKSVTKTGLATENRVYLKPETIARSIKIRVRQAFENLISLGEAPADWWIARGIFLSSAGQGAIGWSMLVPKEIEYCKNFVGMNNQNIIQSFNKIDFLKLTQLSLLRMSYAPNFSTDENCDLELPSSINTFSMALNPDKGHVTFDLFKHKNLVRFNFGGSRNVLIYTGTGERLSAQTILFWDHASLSILNAAQFDLYLQALSLCTFTGSVTVRVAGTRTSASNAAVATLVSKLPGRFYINGVVQS